MSEGRIAGIFTESPFTDTHGSSSAALTGAGLQVIAANDPRPFDTGRFHLLRAIVLTALNDPRGRAQALCEADAASAQISFEDLKEQCAADRAQLGRPA